MASNPLNFKKNHAELTAAESAIAPILTAANIKTVSVKGVDVSVSEAPLADKIVALGKLTASGDKTEDSAALVSANGQLAEQVEAVEGKLLAEKSISASQSQKIIDLTGQLTVKTDALTSETAGHLATKDLLNTTTEAATRLTGELAAQKTALAQRCIAANCLDLSALGKDATDAQRLEAAEKLSFDALFAAYNGAVNSAIAKTGVSFAALPSAVPGGTQAAAPKFKSATELCAAAVQAKAQGKPVPSYESIKRKQ